MTSFKQKVNPALLLRPIDYLATPVTNGGGYYYLLHPTKSQHHWPDILLISTTRPTVKQVVSIPQLLTWRLNVAADCHWPNKLAKTEHLLSSYKDPTPSACVTNDKVQRKMNAYVPTCIRLANMRPDKVDGHTKIDALIADLAVNFSDLPRDSSVARIIAKHELNTHTSHVISEYLNYCYPFPMAREGQHSIPAKENFLSESLKDFLTLLSHTRQLYYRNKTTHKDYVFVEAARNLILVKLRNKYPKEL